MVHHACLFQCRFCVDRAQRAEDVLQGVEARVLELGWDAVQNIINSVPVHPARAAKANLLRRLPTEGLGLLPYRRIIVVARLTPWHLFLVIKNPDKAYSSQWWQRCCQKCFIAMCNSARRMAVDPHVVIPAASLLLRASRKFCRSDFPKQKLQLCSFDTKPAVAARAVRKVQK